MAQDEKGCQMRAVTTQQRFDRDGFLVLERVFPEPVLAALREAAARIVADFDPARQQPVFTTADRDIGRDEYFFGSAESVRCFLEDEAVAEDGRLTCEVGLAINKIGHALHDHVPEFRDFCRHQRIARLLQDLRMQHPRLWQTMVIFKQPRIGGVVGWHQDATYLSTRPARVLGLWVALEDATRDNGCLWMAPGAHRSPLRERYEVDWRTRSGTLRTLDASPWPGPEEAVALEVPAGSLVAFHDHMPHFSSANRSALSRQAFTMHFADARAEWSPRNWLQRPHLPPFELSLPA